MRVFQLNAEKADGDRSDARVSLHSSAWRNTLSVSSRFQNIPSGRMGGRGGGKQRRTGGRERCGCKKGRAQSRHVVVEGRQSGGGANRRAKVRVNRRRRQRGVGGKGHRMDRRRGGARGPLPHAEAVRAGVGQGKMTKARCSRSGRVAETALGPEELVAGLSSAVVQGLVDRDFGVAMRTAVLGFALFAVGLVIAGLIRCDQCSGRTAIFPLRVARSRVRVQPRRRRRKGVVPACARHENAVEVWHGQCG
ncbi:hypothetical protein C8R47DRAFT_740432 [Mycena vitilis]|nr:hypothetical protein C8R47DRAFT_815261 [Mycena vitilis]KAJ6472140.1 hypothetical protein C8R47DRAFT_740432 [Mycena vitilis]